MKFKWANCEVENDSSRSKPVIVCNRSRIYQHPMFLKATLSWSFLTWIDSSIHLSEYWFYSRCTSRKIKRPENTAHGGHTQTMSTYLGGLRGQSFCSCNSGILDGVEISGAPREQPGEH